jgi:hypothetical protein
MPNRDGTGPLGQGPRSGRGSDCCGKGLGQGGLGQARSGSPRFGRFPQTVTSDQTTESAQERIFALEREIADLKEQLRKQ